MNENIPADPPWSDLSLLLAVARAGSFLATGRSRGVSTSTISRRITLLEKSVGATLVERGVEGARLTEAGRRLVETIEAMEHEIGAALRDLPSRSGVLRGTVRLTLGDGFIAAAARVLERFASEHPGVDVEIHGENRVSDLVHREFDLAIRTVHGGEEPLIYRKLGAFGYGLYADRSYVERFGMPDSVEDLARHRIIGFSRAMGAAAQMQWLAQAGVTRFVLTANTFGGMMEGARAGIGIAPLPGMVAEGLVPVLPSFKPKPIDVYLVAHPHALRQPHVRAFADSLGAELKNALKQAS